MKREFLEGLGIEKENIDKIMAENGKDIEGVKATLSIKEAEVKTLQGQLETLNTQIESFEGLNPEELSKQIEDHKKETEEVKRQAEADIADLKFQHELEGAIRDSQARNITAVKALLDIENLKTSSNRSDDIKIAINGIKEENDYLFKDATPSGTGGSLGAGGRNKVTLTKDDIMKIDDPIVRKRTIAENMELFE